MSDIIGDKISRLMEVAGASSQRGLAKFLGVHPAAITEAKKKDKIPADWLVKLNVELGINPGWVLSGEGSQKIESQPKNGIIAATIEPGDPALKLRLQQMGEKASRRNIHLRQIVEWLDREFGETEEQALFFYEDLKARYPSFARFMEGQAEKKRPRENHLVAEPEPKYINADK